VWCLSPQRPDSRRRGAGTSSPGKESASLHPLAGGQGTRGASRRPHRITRPRTWVLKGGFGFGQKVIRTLALFFSARLSRSLGLRAEQILLLCQQFSGNWRPTRSSLTPALACIRQDKDKGEGGRGGMKNKMTKVTYICRGAKQKVVTCSILFLFLFFYELFCAFFLAFRKKGSSKTRKKIKKSIWAHHKKCGFFFRPFFFLFSLPRLFYSISFLSRFWAFRNKGSSKTR
jgi:hypothetical protein